MPLPPIHVPSFGPVHPNLIIRLEADQNYTRVFLRPTTTGKRPARPILCAKNIGRFAEELPTFLRPNKADLINPACIESIRRKPDDRNHLLITLTDGTVIEGARRKTTLLLDAVVEPETGT